jgi:hypothetical protein
MPKVPKVEKNLIQKIKHTKLFKITAVALFFLLFAFSFSFSEEEEGSEESGKEFSRSECRWAVKWINSELSFLMGNGVLKKIVSKDDVFEVRVGEPWYKLEFNQKGEFLKNLSRSREITGHLPFFNIVDNETREIVARVSENSIEILLPVEGFFQYLHLSQGKRNTFY